jgi:hypothetical protein
MGREPISANLLTRRGKASDAVGGYIYLQPTPSAPTEQVMPPDGGRRIVKIQPDNHREELVIEPSAGTQCLISPFQRPARRRS